MSKGNRIVIMAASLLVGLAAVAGPMQVGTPKELVETYDSLADALIATKETERNVVTTILATVRGHAQSVYGDALAKLKGGQDARGELETLASLVAELGNEGNAAVAAIRKRLLEGGHHHHHHHADDADQDDKFDEGFVIVDREAKKTFLDAAKKIGGAKDAAALEAEWKRVESTYKKLFEESGKK